MEVQGDGLNSAAAAVTSDGISFKGARYSCRAALREGWFQKAGESGGWLVEILFDPQQEMPNPIYIGEGKELSPDRLCYLLEQPTVIAKEDVENYQDRLRELKKTRKTEMPF